MNNNSEEINNKYFNCLRSLSFKGLVSLANSLQIFFAKLPKRSELINQIVKKYELDGFNIIAEGILDMPQDTYGFLRCASSSYCACPDDIYISPSIIKQYHLRSGDNIKCLIRSPFAKEKYVAVKSIEYINFIDANKYKKSNIIYFEDLTAEYPKEAFNMDLSDGSPNDIAGRLINIAAPFGKGQRGLIVSSPKSGKTMTLQLIANAIHKNNPECFIIFLLIGERPEEVTEIKRTVHGEVLASTFDELATRHVQLAEIAISRAKRLVESGKDIVVLLDSITRLARAYNVLAPASGRVLSGGMDSQALVKPKTFFGSARNTQEAGSLTILATTLIDTGSKMDEVIFEEFKGTGNMELYLSRRLADRRIFPAIDFVKSGTRRDDLLFTHQELAGRHALSRILQDMDPLEIINNLGKQLIKSKNNKIFFKSMNNLS